MELAVSHSRDDESPIEKARWFQQLPLAERMELLCEMTDLILENNPKAAEPNRAESRSKRIRVLELA